MAVEQKLLDELNLCYTQRWVIAPLLRQQSVAEHCYRVQALVRAIHGEMEHRTPWDLERAIVYALDHDHSEAMEGDMPGVAKDESGVVWPDPDVYPNWMVVVKAADALESYDFWAKWGRPEAWVHPHKPAVGFDNRDMRKVRWYCQWWPELLQAVARVMEVYLGFKSEQIKEVLCCTPD